MGACAAATRRARAVGALPAVVAAATAWRAAATVVAAIVANRHLARLSSQLHTALPSLPSLHMPRPWQPRGQLGWLQSEPAHARRQRHAPGDTHSPCPSAAPQLTGTRARTTAPCQPSKQAHSLAVRCQRRTCRTSSRSNRQHHARQRGRARRGRGCAHAAPRQPSEHSHTPGDVQVPCPLQPPGQTGSPQCVPVQLSKQAQPTAEQSRGHRAAPRCCTARRLSGSPPGMCMSHCVPPQPRSTRMHPMRRTGRARCTRPHTAAPRTRAPSTPPRTRTRPATRTRRGPSAGRARRSRTARAAPALEARALPRRLALAVARAIGLARRVRAVGAAPARRSGQPCRHHHAPRPRRSRQATVRVSTRIALPSLITRTRPARRTGRVCRSRRCVRPCSQPRKSRRRTRRVRGNAFALAAQPRAVSLLHESPRQPALHRQTPGLWQMLPLRVLQLCGVAQRGVAQSSHANPRRTGSHRGWVASAVTRAVAQAAARERSERRRRVAVLCEPMPRPSIQGCMRTRPVRCTRRARGSWPCRAVGSSRSPASQPRTRTRRARCNCRACRTRRHSAVCCSRRRSSPARTCTRRGPGKSRARCTRTDTLEPRMRGPSNSLRTHSLPRARAVASAWLGLLAAERADAMSARLPLQPCARRWPDAMHWPRPEQSPGHSGRRHRAPVRTSLQLQLPGGRSGHARRITGTEQLCVLAAEPSAHSHISGAPHLPLPQPPEHRGISHVALHRRHTRKHRARSTIRVAHRGSRARSTCSRPSLPHSAARTAVRRIRRRTHWHAP